jgi:hypothetical protein
MKSTIPLLTISVLAALAMVGCTQNTPSNSTENQPTNSIVNDTNSMSDVSTNNPATNSLPDMNTNIPASTNQ